MPAYLLGNIEAILDPAAYEEYRSKVPAVIAAFGGRYLVRGGPAESVEGAFGFGRPVVLEFPDMEKLRAFYDSEAYAPLLRIRRLSTVSHVVFLEGYAG